MTKTKERRHVYCLKVDKNGIYSRLPAHIYNGFSTFDVKVVPINIGSMPHTVIRIFTQPYAFSATVEGTLTPFQAAAFWGRYPGKFENLGE